MLIRLLKNFMIYSFLIRVIICVKEAIKGIIYLNILSNILIVILSLSIAIHIENARGDF